MGGGTFYGSSPGKKFQSKRRPIFILFLILPWVAPRLFHTSQVIMDKIYNPWVRRQNITMVGRTVKF